jgi:hypothetical protein
MPYVKTIDLSYEEVNEKLNYDPVAGVFKWKIDAAKNVKAGSIAGTFKGVRLNRKTGEYTRYMYLRIKDYEIPAARVAWLLTHKEWPVSNVLFSDNDPSNLKIDNIRLGRFISERLNNGGKKKHKMTPEAQRHYGLKRYYGIDLAKYQEMLLAQNGVCAICSKPETSVVNGKIKPLAVDHCHNSEKIRGLLCARCNQAIGLLNENPAILSSAIEYLRKNNIADTNTQGGKLPVLD